MSKAVSKIQLNSSRNYVDVNQCRNYRPAAGSRNAWAVPVLNPCSRGPCAAKSDSPFTHRLQARGLCCCKGCETPLCSPALNKVPRGSLFCPGPAHFRESLLAFYKPRIVVGVMVYLERSILFSRKKTTSMKSSELSVLCLHVFDCFQIFLKKIKLKVVHQGLVVLVICFLFVN